MVLSKLSCVSLLTLLSIVSASTNQSYTANTNNDCSTASDIDYQGTYYYVPTDTMDWGFYAKSQGSCDSGSSGKITLKDPVGNQLDCGYLPFDGKLNLISCSNYPRGYMTEGQYVLIIDTVPGTKQYSWNQFTVIHSQSTVTASIPTSTITTTPISLETATTISTPTTTQLNAQKTITITTASITNYATITPAAVTTTSTSTNLFKIPLRIFTMTTITARTTAPCSRARISADMIKTGTGRKPSTKTRGSNLLRLSVRASVFDVIRQIRQLRLRDDIPNTVGMPGLPPTTTIVPDIVVQTSTAATVTSTVTTTSVAPAMTITSNNPTPTVTVFDGTGCSTITMTLPQSTRTVVKQRLAVTIVATTVTLTQTRKVVSTPVCQPTY